MKRTFAAAIVVVLLVVAVSTYALVRIQAPASSSGQASSTGGYPTCSTLRNTYVDQGYEINTLLNSSPGLGQIVCVNVILLNIDGRNLTQSTDTGMSISYNITESSGAIVFQKTCVATSESIPPNSTNVPDAIVGSMTCEGFWNTAAAYEGTLPQAGNYYIDIQASIPYQYLGGFAVATTDVGFVLPR